MPPILITSGTMIPRQLGPMMRAPRSAASSTIWATSARGIRSVTITTSSTPSSSAAHTAPAPLRRAPGGLGGRRRAVGARHPVALQDLEALLLPGTRDAEDGDLLRRVIAELQARLDHPAGDDVDPRVGHDRHHHRDLVD